MADTTRRRKKFSSQAASELLAKMRAVARSDGRHFQAVFQDAFRDNIEARTQSNVRPDVMAHFRASLERNRRLYELLAKS